MTLVCLLINSQTGKISFARHDKPVKTFSFNWKPFGFRSADAHARTRVRAGGGVEPAARSSHKPPDAQKKPQKSNNCAKSREKSRNLSNTVRTDRTPVPLRRADRARSIVLFILLFGLFDGGAAHAVQERERQKSRSFGANKGSRSEICPNRDRFHFPLYDFCFIFRG